MKSVIKFIAKRDGISLNEAHLKVVHTKIHILKNPDKAEEILMEELGLDISYKEKILCK